MISISLLPEVRGKLAIEGLWKRAKTTFGTRSDDETFDCLWKMLLAKNEQRLLLNIKNVRWLLILSKSFIRQRRGKIVENCCDFTVV